MSILQEIQKWSQNLPPWQQHAIAKLYANQELKAEDVIHVYALLKAEHGIPDPDKRVSEKLAAEQVAAPLAADRLIQLASIRNLRNVNALAEGQTLPVAPTGLTVIYGENGSGKSGYSRVLKKACRARDQREPILPNAHKESGSSGTPEASFELLVDGVATRVDWSGAMAASPEQLSSLAIFDAHCARAYVDNHGDFAYAPYGLDILEGLVGACGKLRTMASAEQMDNKANFLPFATLSQTPTVVGKFLFALSPATKSEDVKALAKISEDETARLATLTKTLAEVDPKRKAQALRLRGTLLGQLATRMATSVALLSDSRLAALRNLIAASTAAAKAAELASKQFRETPGFLPGTGGESWKLLLDAAREFAAESHSGAFPHLGPEAACPLCQNTLGAEGNARIEAFDAFVKQAAEQAAKRTRDAAIAAYRAVENAQTNLTIDDVLREELDAAVPDLATACVALQQSLVDRRTAAIKATAPGGDWDAIQALPDDLTGTLEGLKTQMFAAAKALEDATDPKARTALALEHAELDARRLLGTLKEAVLDAVEKMARHKRLQACISAAGTTGISRKSTELAKTMATPEVASALNAELKALNVHELQVVMKNVSPQGKTQFKLALEIPGGGSPAAILSEGEQRAIAIASFLAEVNLGKGSGGVVFDDPVSSLDHRRRWQVAQRLAKEATKRQVIVFTHDIYFLCVLQQEAEAVGLDALTQCIRRDTAGFGVQTTRLPFDTLGTSKRVKALRQMHQEVAAVHMANAEDDTKRLTREAYFHLRLAWERAVEEILFQGVVSRFDEGVSTQKLKYVVVEHSDHAAIDAGMTRCSKFAHDPAAQVHLPTPHPDELIADIETLDTWRRLVEDRKASIAAQRA